MAIQFDNLNSQSLATQIAGNIRDAILRGDLKVDERLSTEEELARRFDVSRPTIREALKRLAAQNLIRSQRGPAGGTFVKRPSQQEMSTALCSATTLMVSMGEFQLQDVAEARHQMERTCCRLAATRISEAELQRMRAALAIQRQPVTDEQFCSSDVDFHRALVDGCANPVLQFNMFTVIESLQPIANMVISHFRDRDIIVQQHQSILEALESGDAEAAVAALDEQMLYLTEQYRAAQTWKASQHSPD